MASSKERREREKDLDKVMTKMFSKFGGNYKLFINSKNPNYNNHKKPLRHNITKLLKTNVKEKTLKTAIGKGMLRIDQQTEDNVRLSSKYNISNKTDGLARRKLSTQKSM